MIKCKVIKNFSLKEFEKLKNIKRYNPIQNQYGKLYLNDEFECDEEMAKYLMGNNKDREIVVEIVEIIPEEKEKNETTEKELIYCGDKNTPPQYIERQKSNKKKKSSKK